MGDKETKDAGSVQPPYVALLLLFCQLPAMKDLDSVIKNPLQNQENTVLN